MRSASHRPDGDEATVTEAEEVLRRIEAEVEAIPRPAMSGEPKACAASSMIGTIREFVERRRRKRYRQMAFVRSVIFRSTSPDRDQVTRSMSTKTGVPRGAIASAVVERERRADHLVAAADTEGVEDDDDRIRPVATPIVSGTRKTRPPRARTPHVRAEDERPFEHVGESLLSWE
jgi:hypothetical protein